MFPYAYYFTLCVMTTVYMTHKLSVYKTDINNIKTQYSMIMISNDIASSFCYSRYTINYLHVFYDFYIIS